MWGAVEGRYYEWWPCVDVWDARCFETTRIDPEEGAEVRVLRFETRDLVFAYLCPVHITLGARCLGVYGGRGIWTSRCVRGDSGDGSVGIGRSGGIHGGGGSGGGYG